MATAPTSSPSETTNTTIPHSPTSPKKRNAFTDLMTPKRRKASLPSHHLPDAPTVFVGRDGLGAYIASPSSFPSSRVITHSEKYVIINDLYPKSSLHTLLLPRDASKMLLHPFIAFEDPVFLADVRGEVAKLRTLVASELRRRYGRFSAKDRAREEAMDKDPPPDKLPEGRDWEKDVICGVHAGPSMNHLHVHVLSVDRVSECMRHRKHYNSFATPFFVGMEDFPLAKGDVRRHPGREGYLEREFRCWRCGKGFGNKFRRLKEHLEEEFDGWKRE